MDGMIASVAGYRITPVDLQQYIQVQAGTSFHITYVRKIMRLYNLSPKVYRERKVREQNSEFCD